MKRTLLITWLILLFSCQDSSILEPVTHNEVNYREVYQTTRECSLELYPDLQQLISGEYVFYVNFDSHENIPLIIPYTAPSRSEVTWTVDWLQGGFCEIQTTYPESNCRGVFQTGIHPEFINWVATISAGQGDSFQYIIVLILQAPDNSIVTSKKPYPTSK